MKKVEKKIRDIISIRILFIFDFVILLILFATSFYLGFFSLVTYIFLPILLVCISLQFVLFFKPNGKVIFDLSGVTIITKNTSVSIYWDNVKCIYYNSILEIFPLLKHFTIELLIKLDDEIIDFNKNFGNIIIFKDEYLNIISFIPHHVLDINEFMIYRNIIEKKKNKYKK